MSAWLAIVLRDARLGAGGEAVIALVFFVITVSLFPLALGPEPQLLARIGPGVIWVAGLLAALLSLERLFAEDARDGSLDQLRLSGMALELMVLAKACAHWLLSGLPLAVMTPLIGLLFGLPAGMIGILVITLALGMPTISLIGSVAAALAVGSRRTGLLIAILVLPLSVPVIIFALAAAQAWAWGETVRPHLLLLAACFAAGLTLAPLAAAAGLRLAMES